MELKINPPTIILGCFQEKVYQHYATIYPVEQFSDFAMSWEDMGIVKTVEIAAQRANEILFVLDGVFPPIDDMSLIRSVVCAELVMLCSDPDLFFKTTFIQNYQIIEFNPEEYGIHKLDNPRTRRSLDIIWQRIVGGHSSQLCDYVV